MAAGEITPLTLVGSEEGKKGRVSLEAIVKALAYTITAYNNVQYQKQCQPQRLLDGVGKAARQLYQGRDESVPGVEKELLVNCSLAMLEGLLAEGDSASTLKKNIVDPINTIHNRKEAHLNCLLLSYQLLTDFIKTSKQSRDKTVFEPTQEVLINLISCFYRLRHHDDLSIIIDKQSFTLSTTAATLRGPGDLCTCFREQVLNPLLGESHKSDSEGDVLTKIDLKVTQAMRQFVEEQKQVNSAQALINRAGQSSGPRAQPVEVNGAGWLSRLGWT